ncbi:trehalose-phosphatase [Glutamicibacter halophytocola]|uniref:Trehalose 6-phosphate phosphatase n=1 Tax=Glutamicibacter halophytocola TaxID=1933880 RepID=A0AA94XT73_9MICC|nr:trehalose-phosphatase [Glutamicibacter halophytocola]UUX59554.1 trehalose-phosphatase [Glutamicibacter halophytocola]
MSDLDPELHAALSRFAAHQNILVALDFDGTMSPIVDRPEDARPLPESAEVFERLRQLPGVFAALVSGRNLASLAQVYPEPLPEICIGSHGAERLLPEPFKGQWIEKPLSSEQQDLLARITKELAAVADSYEDVSLEYKPSATVLHVRRATTAASDAALSEAKAALNAMGRVKLLEGKAVLEASVHQGDKGESLTWLKDLLQVDAVLFIGDDVTDENGFKVLEPNDLGIKVGSGPTLATHHIASPQQLPELLQILVSMRD